MRWVLMTIAGLLSAKAAQAGPWVRKAGDVYARAAVAAESVDGLSAYRYDGYGEVGLTGQWTLTAKAEQVRFADAADFNAEGFRVTLRRPLYRRKALIVSAEMGAVHGAAIGGVTGCDRLGGEARLTAGYSGSIASSDWYVFADVATRLHAEGCWRERAEFGAGQEIASNIFVVTQYWFERGSERSRSDKIETALLWRVGDIDLSVAWREELSGRFNETGFVFAIARRF